jgi:hypothetical protein
VTLDDALHSVACDPTVGMHSVADGPNICRAQINKQIADVEQVDPAYIRKRPLPAILRIPSVVARNLVSTAA